MRYRKIAFNENFLWDICDNKYYIIDEYRKKPVGARNIRNLLTNPTKFLYILSTTNLFCSLTSFALIIRAIEIYLFIPHLHRGNFKCYIVSLASLSQVVRTINQSLCRNERFFIDDSCSYWPCTIAIYSLVKFRFKVPRNFENP